MANEKRLTDDQTKLLREAVYDFVICVVYGLDACVDEDNFDDLLQSKIIEPFIIPLMNGKDVKPLKH